MTERAPVSNRVAPLKRSSVRDRPPGQGDAALGQVVPWALSTESDHGRWTPTGLPGRDPGDISLWSVQAPWPAIRTVDLDPHRLRGVIADGHFPDRPSALCIAGRDEGRRIREGDRTVEALRGAWPRRSTVPGHTFASAPSASSRPKVSLRRREVRPSETVREGSGVPVRSAGRHLTGLADGAGIHACGWSR